MRQPIVQLAAVLTGCLPFALVTVVGTAFLSSTASGRNASPWLRVAQLADLPATGVPVRVPVKLPQRDAWSRLPDRVLGYVYLRRLPDGRVSALRADHHEVYHIPVAFDADAQNYRSMCWLLRFDLDGREIVDGARMVVGDRMEAVPVQISGEAVFVRYTAADAD